MALPRLFAATAALALLTGLPSFPARAAVNFGQQDISPERIVAIAASVQNGERYSLIIVEQISDSRSCWREEGSQPTQVEPLLLNFDFTGICDRQTDSNGYSLRIAGSDLGLVYRLEVVRRSGDIVLRAVANDHSSPPIEIGRTQGIAGTFSKIQLNPGWRLTRRTYNGQPLGHIYLSHDQPLDVAIARASPPPTPASPPAQGPARPPVGAPLPPPTIGHSGVYYRVIVPGGDEALLQRVRSVEPESFRATVDGQSVVQVGLFRDAQRAEEVRRELALANLEAKILTVSAPAVASTPPVPRIPQGAIVVALDPGHGGRDPGAVGIGGLREKDINITIARRVQQQLQQQGITVAMTRNDDREVDLEPRVDFAEQVRADVFVSLHANAISLSRPDVNGLETYYYDTGLQLAQIIHNTILQQVSISDRGVRQARFYVLRNTSMPAVLVETGFVTGQTDAARFRDPGAVNQIADAIAQGVLTYLGR